MKIEKTNYVIMKIGNIEIGRETEYLVYDSEKGYVFTNDILMASKYASRIAAKYEKFELDYNKLYSFLKDFAYQSAKVVVSIIVSELKPSVTEENCKGLGLWSVLSEEKGIEYRKLLTYTSRKIYSELVTLNETILDEQGSIQVEPLVKAISFIVDSHGVDA